MKRLGRLLLLSLLAAFAAGCAIGIPKDIRDPAAEGPAIGEVRADPQRFRTAAVRWGGEIVSVRNEPSASWIEVLARPLSSWGEPLDALGEGRFLARVDGFIDPAEYAAGRDVTVSGEVVGSERRPVGEYDYLFPVVEVRAVHLWPEPPLRRRVRYMDPLWDDPFWWPWRYHGFWPAYSPWPHPHPPHHPPPHAPANP